MATNPENRPLGTETRAVGPEGRSIGELLRDLANDVTRLVRDELALARTETRAKAEQAMRGALTIVAGLLLAFAALIILLDAIVYGLAEHMPAWLAAVIVGGVVAIIGLILVRVGQKDLSARGLMLERTTESIRRDVHMVKEQTP